MNSYLGAMGSPHALSQYAARARNTQGPNKGTLKGIFCPFSHIHTLWLWWHKNGRRPNAQLSCRCHLSWQTNLIFLFAGIIGGLADDDDDALEAGHVS